MPRFTLIEMNMWPEIQSKAKPQALQLKKLPLKIDIDCDSKLWKAIGKDPLLHQKMVDAVNDNRKKTTINLIKLVSHHDALIVKAPDARQQQQQAKEFKGRAEKEVSALRSQAPRAVEKVWEQRKRTQKEYRNYKIKAGASVAVDVVDITLGVTGAVGSAGASLALSIIVVLRSTAGMVQKLAKLAVEAETLQKKLVRDLKELHRAYAEASRTSVGAQELAGNYVQKVFNVDLAPTISSCKTDNEQFGNKLKGLDVDSHKVSSNLGKTLTDVDKLTDKIKDRKSNLPDRKRQKLLGSVGKLEKSVNGMIEKVIGLQERVNKGNVAHKDYTEIIQGLKAKKPTWSKRAERSLVLIDLGFGVTDLAGLGTNAAMTFANEIVIDKAGDKILPS